MKKVIIISCLAVSAYTFQACSNGSGNHDNVDSAKNMNAQKDTSQGMKQNDTTAMAPMQVDKDAADFAVAAANGGMKEVALSQVAQQKATSQRVKDFAAMMIHDHTDAGNVLKSLATSKNISLPASVGDDAKKDIDKLNKKTGADFDKDYMHMMLEDHKKATDDFKKASADCKDPDLKNFATQTLPTLMMHLDSAEAISGKRIKAGKK